MKAILITFLIAQSLVIKAQFSHAIVWKDDRAIAVKMTTKLRDGTSVRLHGNEVSIIGKYEDENSALIFYPLLPFTAGLTYDIFQDNKIVGDFTVPLIEKTAPEILNIYPLADTIPENTLKVYLQFSTSMVQGRALENIQFIDLKTKSELEVFLDLKPELWNEDGTILTLWLDPGRIKRDLGPNQLLGSPMVSEQEYQLRILNDWRSTSGVRPKDTYSKEFVTKQADRERPKTDKWQLIVPDTGSNDPLIVDFHEPMDYLLALESINVFQTGMRFTGQIEIGQNQRVWKFHPNKNWSSGSYKLEIDSRFEDLAGNNLNREFDKDLNSGKNEIEQEIYIVDFIIP